MRTSYLAFLLLNAFLSNSVGRKFDSVPDTLYNREAGGNGNCGSLSATACAVLYTEEFCYGESQVVAINPADNDQFNEWLSRNDVESVSVATGCTFVGYEFEKRRGRGISISADNSSNYHITDLEEHENIFIDKIRSVECSCEEGSSSGTVSAAGGPDCSSVPEGACGVLYSDEFCGGKSHAVAISAGKQQLGEGLSWNDIESVSVAVGCTLRGHEFDNSIVDIIGDNTKDYHLTALREYRHILDADIRSVECLCEEGGSSKRVEAVQETDCPSVPEGACAVLHSDEFHCCFTGAKQGWVCGGKNRVVANNALNDEEMGEWLWRNNVESVSVAAGCTLLGYEFENARGRGISISADNTTHNMQMEEYKHIFNENIRSVECQCGEGSSSRRVAAVGGPDCTQVPEGACAVLFTKENCKGQRLEVLVGNSERYEDTWLGWEEPDSMSVAPGCTFTALESDNSVAIVEGGPWGSHIEDLEAFLKLRGVDVERFLKMHGVKSGLLKFQCFCQ